MPTSAGIEPATSWSPNGPRIQLSHRGRPSYISVCSLSVLYSSKFILMATSLGTTAVSVTMVHCIEDIYSFAVTTTNIFIECNKNISIWMLSLHEIKIFIVLTVKSTFSFYFYCLHANHGSTFSVLTCEALERQKQKVSGNQNILVTKMFSTF